MNLKIWFIAAVFLAACVGFSYQDDLANSEDVPMEDIAAELAEVESDLEDPSSKKVPRPFCPKYFVRKCFYFKHCNKLLRLCVCVKRRYGDETEYDNQVNDAVAEDEAKEIEETNVADPSKTKPPRKCPRHLIRKCVVVMVGCKKRSFCFCLRRCYGDETSNDNQGA